MVSQITEAWQKDYAHRIWIEFPFEPHGPFVIPVPPAEITAGHNANLKRYDVIGFGEILSMGGISLQSMKWESSFYQVHDEALELCPGGDSQHIDPIFWRAWFQQCQRLQMPLQLTIENANIDMRMAVESFRWGIPPGDPGAMDYQIELVEQRRGVIREFRGVDFPSVDTRPRPFGTFQETYVVKPGQTLIDISIAVYGSMNRWRDIYIENIRQLWGDKPMLEGRETEHNSGFLYHPVDVLTPNDAAFWMLWRTTDPLPANMVLRIPELVD